MKNSLIGFINHKTGRRTLINVLVILALSFILSHFLPENIEDYGILVCIPAVFLVVYIFLTKRILESLVLASFIGFIMISKGNLSSLFLFSDVTLETLISEEDFRLARIELCTRTKRGRVLCANLEKIVESTMQVVQTQLSGLEISKLAVSQAETLHTLPSYYAIQIAKACTRKCFYCPYPTEYEKKYGCVPQDTVHATKVLMNIEDFSSLVKKIDDFSEEAVLSLSLWWYNH